MSVARPKADLTQGPIFKHILRMSLPMMIGMSAHMAVNIIDGIYAGRLGTQESLAVLNYGFPFFYLFFAVLNGIGSGLASNLARAIGAQKKAAAEKTLTQTLWFCLAAFAFFVLCYPLVLPAYLKFQGASPEAAEMTRRYLTALFTGLPFVIIATLLGSSLRAEGNTRTLMNAMMVSTLANVVCAPFLIYDEFRFAGVQWHGLGLSVTGAGLATTGSSLLSCALIAWHYLRGKSLLQLRFKLDMTDISGFRDSLRVAFPSMLSQILMGLNLALLTYLAKPFGDAAVAAVGIAARLDILPVFPGLAIMIAVVSLVGQNYGAGRIDRVRETLRVGFLTAFGLLATIGLTVFFLRAHLIGWFKPDAASLQSAMHFLSILSFGYGFIGLSIVSAGAFQGLGRGIPYLSITFMRMFALTLPAALVLSRMFGEKGLHFAPTLAATITGIFSAFWSWRAVARLQSSPKPANQTHLSPAL